MSGLCDILRCGGCPTRPILPLYIMTVFHVGIFFVQSASLGTNFSFLEFAETDDFVFFGESARYNSDTLSYTIEPIRRINVSTTMLNSCDKMYYKDKVGMKSKELSAAASFSTSFTFSITQRDHHSYGSATLMFIIGTESTFAMLANPQAYSGKSKGKFLAVEFDTYYDLIAEDSSDSYIGVNINTIKRSNTRDNLCEGNRTSYSFPWTGRTYTAWIAYNGSTKSLGVWFANGSLREEVLKPASPGLVDVKELDLLDTFEDDMYVGFSGTVTPPGMVVAVKRLKHDSEHVHREFLAEVSSISQIRHRNLVHLRGWCQDDGNFLLVYEYMSNGSLDEWLFPSRRRHPDDPKFKRFEVIPWEIRFSILAGVAAAVEYLHEEWVQCVLHRDIKSSNVMLDENFNPHLGDFGLARLMDHEKLEKTTMMGGTFGYMAPEMHYTGKATKESDVYSFGTLMLEVLCGRKPVNLQVEDPNDDFMLVQHVWRAHERGNILTAVDPELLKFSRTSTVASTQIAPYYSNSICEQVPINQVDPNRRPVLSTDCSILNVWEERRVVSLLHLGLRCCLSDPESRPSMKVVKQVIMQVQSITAEEDPMSALKCMPPLPSMMPLLRESSALGSSLIQVPTASMVATKAALQEVEAQVLPEMRPRGELRRRFLTN
ncbi:hypothetical protein KC19_7G170800 [Ceratodon purpureus]|uniref:non-specific serine/threonine protein kinase n=1 Tax=Ceratodon purpureus TaxID=3225 RepID=A0A8T0H914_CERPU|nr:hypothetical protein KC19_7G170800 [Ceratodon purpureus]